MNSQLFADGLRDVLGNSVGIDLGFFLIRRRSGRGSKSEMSRLLGLDYQACDDQQSFSPASVQLSRTLAWRSPIRERLNLKK
jgi:hypothetical protein